MTVQLRMLTISLVAAGKRFGSLANNQVRAAVLVACGSLLTSRVGCTAEANDHNAG